MKYISSFILFLLVSISAFGQNDVTKFLGIPVDGPKSEMVKALKSKGFKQNIIGDNEYFSGRFNGMDVHIYISLESGKVSRLMVCDENTMGEGDIKIRFNNLCHQSNMRLSFISSLKEMHLNLCNHLFFKTFKKSIAKNN